MVRRAAFQLLENDNTVRTFFLSDHRYIHFLSNIDQLVRGPFDNTNGWATFRTAGWNVADAFLREVSAPTDRSVKAFVFNGNHVMHIQVGVNGPWPDSRLRAPETIATRWTALHIADFTNVHAAFLLRSDATGSQAWFFFNNRCVLIEFTNTPRWKTSVVQGPAIITTIFSSLRQARFDFVDCVLDTATLNERWFFSGTQAVLINTDTDTIVEGPDDIETLFETLHTAGFY